MKNLKPSRASSNLALILQLIGFAILAGACTSSTSQAFHDSTCNPPCWENIVPGVTNYQQSLGILENLGTVNMETLKEFGSANEHRLVWRFFPNTGDKFGELFFQDDIVSVISLTHPNGVLILEEAFERLGQPTYYLALLHTPEKAFLTIHFLYPSQGYALLA